MTPETPEPLDLQELASPERVQSAIDASVHWVSDEALSLPFLIQIMVLAAAFILGFGARKPLSHLLDRLTDIKIVSRYANGTIRLIGPLIGPGATWLLLSASLYALQSVDFDSYLIRTAANLVAAWAVIRLVSAVIRDPFWSRLVAILAWSVAALNILGWLDPFLLFLDSLGFSIGDGEAERRISLRTVLEAIVVIIVFYWFASSASSLLSTRINKLPSLTPSARILVTKSAQLLLMMFAALMALSVLGIDLSAFAIFSGAIGLGIGFGLQKIFSNLVSGVILLLDRSIEPGDVITVEETYGTVNTLGMRFASVITRDGHEHLIPNEEFITTKVINWSYSDTAVRIKRKIGISYDSDVRKARELVVAAAESVDRVAKSPATRCHLVDFGDSAVILEVRFWISDPGEGVYNVTSEVLMAIWDSFHENGINFPFPQRDVHLSSSDPVRVEVVKD